VYRLPRRFVTFPEDPPPYGLLAVSALVHVLCFGGAIALSAFIGSRVDQSKVYIVNLVPAAPSLGAPAAAPSAPAARAPEPRRRPARRPGARRRRRKRGRRGGGQGRPSRRG